MRINQSLIKRLSGNYCPKKLKAELDGVYKRPASLAMISGQYFEYRLFGTKNREGEIPVLPLKKNGEKRIDQIRIEQQAANFKTICRKNDIKIFGHDRAFNIKMFGHEIHGIWDGYGLYRRRPTVIDIKITKDVNNDFGDFSWGDFEKMDKIQAHNYMEAGKRIDGIQYDFLFMVFDYKPDPEYRLYHVPYDSNVPIILQQRIEEAAYKLQMNEKQGWPAIGFAEECSSQHKGEAVSNCPFSETCPKFTTKREMMEVWMNKKIEKSLRQEDLSVAQAEVDKLLAGIVN